MCVSIQALVSGLLLRVDRDGHVPDVPELTAILALGYARADLRRVFAERLARNPSKALAVIDALP